MNNYSLAQTHVYTQAFTISHRRSHTCVHTHTHVSMYTRTHTHVHALILRSLPLVLMYLQFTQLARECVLRTISIVDSVTNALMVRVVLRLCVKEREIAQLLFFYIEFSPTRFATHLSKFESVWLR